MKRVLVLQLCRFGDILQTTPMLRGLRRHYPEASITLVVRDTFMHVPVPHALFDERVGFPYRAIAAATESASSWPAGLKRLQAFVRGLGEAPFDLTLNLTHSDLTGLLVSAIPAREVRGALVAPDRTRVVRGCVMTYFWASQLSRAQGCFNLVDLYNWMAGVPAERGGLEIDVPDAARERMRAWLAARGLGERSLIAVQLGASDERKRWPPERFADALNDLDPALGDVVLVGTEAERPLADRARAQLRRPVHDSLGQAPIFELAALLERSRLLLTNDTGTMHVATAVGTRVVDVSTGPVFAHETGPYGEGHLVLEPRMACFPCVGGAECHHIDCRNAFTPRDVASLVRYALDRGPLPRPAGARILSGRFRPSGALEYRPLWGGDGVLQDAIRPASADVWEATLLPTARPAMTDVLSDADVAAATDGTSATLRPTADALSQLASRADHIAGLARGAAGLSLTTAQTAVEEIGRELESLRLESELQAAGRPIVAYLKVRLDSCTETDIARLLHTYATECAAAAQRARQLAVRLARSSAGIALASAKAG